MTALQHTLQRTLPLAAAAVLMSVPVAVRAQSPGEGLQASASVQSSDSAAAVATIHAFHEALEAGDTAGVVALLADDLHVAEGGGIETREEYISHHLPGDMRFAGMVDRTSSLVQVVVTGDAAWVMSSTETHGTVRDREINSRGVELMVLSRSSAGWRIRTIQWASRQAR